MMRRQTGFTLLELLLALAIFSLMSVMAYGGLTAVIQTRETVNQAMERLTAVQKALYRIQADLESAQARPVRDEYGDVQPALRRDLDGLGLALTRGGWRNPLSLPRSGMQRVHYRLEEKKLLRRSWPVLDRYSEQGYIEVELLSDLEDVRWRFLDEPPAAAEDFDDLDWQEQWPPVNEESEPGDLPIAVEMLLTTEDWGEIRMIYRLSPGMPRYTEGQGGLAGGLPGDGTNGDTGSGANGDGDSDDDEDEDDDFEDEDDDFEDEDF